MTRIHLLKRIKRVDRESCISSLINEIEVFEYGYIWYQQAEDYGIDLDQLAIDLDLEIVRARLTCGFFDKKRKKTSGLEGLSSKDIKRRRKKDINKQKALN